MAKIFVNMKLMLESPETDAEKVGEKIVKTVKEFAGCEEVESNIEQVAFGIKAVNIKFSMDEEKGSLDPLEKKLNALEEVASAEVTGVSRALG